MTGSWSDRHTRLGERRATRRSGAPLRLHWDWDWDWQRCDCGKSRSLCDIVSSTKTAPVSRGERETTDGSNGTSSEQEDIAGPSEGMDLMDGREASQDSSPGRLHPWRKVPAEVWRSSEGWTRAPGRCSVTLQMETEQLSSSCLDSFSSNCERRAEQQAGEAAEGRPKRRGTPGAERRGRESIGSS